MNSFGSAFLKGDRLLLGDPSSATIFVAIYRLECHADRRNARGEEVGQLSVAQFRLSETDALGCWGTLAFLNRHGMGGSKVV